jgi:acyl-CoA thioester hydrolase
MAGRFTRRFRVRHYELDTRGHVHDAVLVQYMQEAAIEASTAAGFSPAWYREHGTAWVVRRLSVRWLEPVTYGDEVEVATWVATMRGVRSSREYDLTRAGGRVARGRVEWVYLDRNTGQLVRFPEDFAAAFAPAGDLEELGVRLAGARPTEGAHRHASRRRVQFHELDPARHVSHAAYLHWLDQARRDALRAAGQEGWEMRAAGHEVEYLAPALDDDSIEIASWVCEVGETVAAWAQEVRNATTGKALARAYVPVAFVDGAGRATTPHRQAVEYVLRGPRA